ncbi:MAG TPA: Asp23/Gls24 family envelope stress response protein, partial [Sandaracinaceae bacterium LLY-WYZ-13_1]|nr:Asp23/Gls24 family envelope stress response protein [Sandaracinaceae bacterium LLY-WYZ-13_1]
KKKATKKKATKKKATKKKATKKKATKKKATKKKATKKKATKKKAGGKSGPASSGEQTITLHRRHDGVRGAITLDEDVVATIAGLCARRIEGIHSLGKPRLISVGDSYTRGVDVEVGQEQAAIDLEVVMEYGADIVSVADRLRQSIAEEIGRMASREVVEVNIHVTDIQIPEEDDEEPDEAPRVV